MRQIFAMDEDPFEGMNLTDLEKHDRRFHPNGFKEGDSCRYRDALSKGDNADDLTAAEKQEANENDSVSKIIDQWNKLGNLVVTMPQDEDKYEEVLSKYGIDKDSEHWQYALGAIRDAGEDFEKNGIDPDDPADTVELKKQVLGLHDLLLNATKPTHRATTANNTPATKKPKKAKSGKANNADRKDLLQLRDYLERAARLLNGRAGNIQALQSSSRFSLLNDIGTKPNFLLSINQLASSDDADVSAGAKKLLPIVNNIQKSAKNNWNGSAGMVPSESDMPIPADSDDDE